MLNDIYNKRIIELAGNIPRLGRLSDPDASAVLVALVTPGAAGSAILLLKRS
jgi:NifU-like protein involved in Fe-S cluster formation